jgi:hypothetical protein
MDDSLSSTKLVPLLSAAFEWSRKEADISCLYSIHNTVYTVEYRIQKLMARDVMILMLAYTAALVKAKFYQFSSTFSKSIS